MKDLAPSPAVLRPREAARYIGLSLATLSRMRGDGSGPEFIQLHSRSIAYTRESLDRFISSRPSFSSTSQRCAKAVAA